MSLLTRDRICACDDLKRELVDIPEWGGSVYVRVMTGVERDAVEGLYVKNKYDNYRAAVAVACACDESGKSIFQSEDVAKLGEKSGTALVRIFDAAMAINKLLSEHVETAAKNSEASHGSDSP